jgi:hypothetical protein
MKQLLQLVWYTGPVLAKMALSGQIARRDVWVAFEGAGKYVAAIARGLIAPVHEQEGRAGHCRQCTARVDVQVTVRGEPITFGWCGGVLAKGESQTGPDGKGPTCGCMVTQDGQPVAKTMVMGERCPRGKW